MKSEDFIKTIERGKIKWNRHALERMTERKISIREVKETIRKGELIENYSESEPYPSGFFFALTKLNRPLHVVAAYDDYSGLIYIITVYIPDTIHFKRDFKTRIK